MYKENKDGKLEWNNEWNKTTKSRKSFRYRSKKIHKKTKWNNKKKYAIILIVILAIQLLALITIFVLKGYGILIYSDSTFNLFITGGIAEVFVLVRVIVKYLFKDNLTNALNIILENNNKVKDNEKYKNNKSQKNWKVLFSFDKFQHVYFT